MLPNLRLTLSTAALAMALSRAALAAEPSVAAAGDRTLPVDPVEFVLRGAEVAGLPEFTATSGDITYEFATRENQLAFEREPARFEVQLGGACARMGPLSGTCGLGIHAVHDGRLYVFASTACRDGFLKAPERLLETDDALPQASAESETRGRALLEQALGAVGGAAAVDAVRSYAERAERTEVSGGTDYKVVNEAWLTFAPGAARAGSLRRDESWNDHGWGYLVAEGRGARLSSGERHALAAVPQRAFEKEMGRNLLAVLRNRRAPEAVVAHAGSDEVDGTAVELVAVALDGRTTTLAIDPRDGAVLALRYRGRDENAALTDLEVRLTDWRPAGALKLPFARAVLADGTPQPGLSTALGAIELDGALDPELFRTAK